MDRVGLKDVNHRITQGPDVGRPQEMLMSLTKLYNVIPATLLGAAISMSAWADDAPTASPAAALPGTPEAVVDAQLVAYNKRDLEAFLSFYADDAILARHPDQVTQTGKAEMRTRYQSRFSNPNVHAEIIKRVTFDRFVIDHERITAPPSKEVREAVAIYEVKDGKIFRVTFLEK
jgi:hypothetical protein